LISGRFEGVRTALSILLCYLFTLWKHQHSFGYSDCSLPNCSFPWKSDFSAASLTGVLKLINIYHSQAADNNIILYICTYKDLFKLRCKIFAEFSILLFAPVTFRRRLLAPSCAEHPEPQVHSSFIEKQKELAIWGYLLQ